MKKSLFLLFVIFIANCVHGQETRRFSIDWKEKSVVNDGVSNFVVPRFNSNNFWFDFGNRTLSYVEVLSENKIVDVASLNVSDIVYELVSDVELGDLSTSSIPSDFQIIAENKMSRGKVRTVFKCNPIVRTKGQNKRVKSFVVNYSFGSVSQKRSLANSSISNSILSSGSWHRFSLQKSGAYRVTKSFLSSMGMDVSSINPNKIRLFGNGGRMLPLLNSELYPQDLQEVAFQFIGNGDSVFDDNEYILFYGEGVDVWNEESETHVNLYDNKSYYYLSFDTGVSKLMNDISIPSGSAVSQIKQYDSYLFHELDYVNPAKLGRKWFGESFEDEPTYDFNFSIPNIIASESCKIKVSGLAAAPIGTSLMVTVDGVRLNTISFSSVSGGTVANENAMSDDFVPSSADVTVGITYDNKGVPSAAAYLDYIIIEAKSHLKGIGKQFLFQDKSSGLSNEVVEYFIEEATAISQVWDVTDIYNVTKYKNTSQNTISLKQQFGTLRKYVAVDLNDLYQPTLELQSAVLNQDIKGTVFTDNQGGFKDVDYLIISPNAYVFQAERLAEFHRMNSQLNVKVLTLNEIYHEFSSGKQDVGAIRNAVKYVYENASSEDKRVKYVCLFGGASYDYKDRIKGNTNIVPVFHSNDSRYSLIKTFMSDDFYALMDSDEGEMNTISAGGLDLSVGRMVFEDAKGAEDVVNKVFAYYDQSSYGRWRNDIMLVSDDVDAEWEATLQQDLDDIGSDIELKRPFFNVKKVHSDAYLQETSSGGERYPDVREKIVSELGKGVLIMNYFGHGGEDGLAGERILEKSDVENLNNINNLPLFITATCEYSRFDNPERPTAGEATYLNPKGGAISLISTTRQIGVTSGAEFNKLLMKKLLAFDEENYPTISEALRLTKNEINFDVKIVSYIGDPALRLAIPQSKVVLTHLNDLPLGVTSDTLKALSLVKLNGSVLDVNGNLISTHNGEVEVDVFDKKILTSTLGNDNTLDSSNQKIILDYETSGELVFRGKASVENGNFELSFVVPKDIKIDVGNARVSLYSRDKEFVSDYSGYDTAVKIGGFNENAAADITPPEVVLYMNSESFVSGGVVNSSPVLIATLKDENGISTAGGVGHDIVAVLDGNESNPIVLNDFYSTDLNVYQSGKLSYPFSDLSEGMHSLEFRVWDVYNNSTTQTIQFQVVANQNLVLDKVLNYPNPFVGYTEFWFNHNKPNEPLDVHVQVFTVTGKLIKTLRQTVINSGFLSRDITWDGLDDFGEKVGKGVYVYKLKVIALATNQQAQEVEKLVVF